MRKVHEWQRHGSVPKTFGYCWRTYFTTDKAESSAGVAPSFWACNGGMGEAKVRRFGVRQQ